MKILTRRLSGIAGRSRRLVLGVRRLAYKNVAHRSGVTEAEIHQVESTTENDRYPKVFQVVKQHFDDLNKTPHTILSFGCSTGQECSSLREYFPDSMIVGADINKDSLQTAKRNCQDPNTVFVDSSTSELEEAGPYDLIFAMSVLCRWPETKFLNDSSSMYPFSKFEKAVQRLDSSLTPGGLFVVVNSSYWLTDALTGYDIIEVPGQKEWMPKFDRDNQRVEDPEADTNKRAFIKNTTPSHAKPIEFRLQALD